MGSRTILCAALTCAAAFGLAAPDAHAATTIGDWRFDEPDGQVALDAGPYGLDGRLGPTDAAEAADPTRVAGLQGGALRFSGGQFVRLPDAPETAPATLTAEAVVRAAGSPGAYRYIISRGAWKCIAGSYGLYSGPDGGLAFYVLGADGYYRSPAAAAADVWDGRWHHVAGTYDGATVRLYVDGREVGAGTHAAVRIDYARTTATTLFGDYLGSCRRPFAGDIDAIHLWDGARTPAELREDAAQALGTAAPRVDAPLTPAVPGGVLPAGPLPATSPPAAAGAPPRACRLRLAPRRLRSGHRVVRARVSLRGARLRGVRVVLRRAGQRRTLAAARTGVHGSARLALRVRAGWRLVGTVQDRPACAAVGLRVARPARR